MAKKVVDETVPLPAGLCYQLLLSAAEELQGYTVAEADEAKLAAKIYRDVRRGPKITIEVSVRPEGEGSCGLTLKARNPALFDPLGLLAGALGQLHTQFYGKARLMIQLRAAGA